MKLLDVGVLLALSYAGHPAHSRCVDWWHHDRFDVGVCRVAQMGLLRLLTNRTVMGKDVVTRAQAWSICEDWMSDPRVSWIQEPGHLDDVWKALSRHDDASHQLWTDDYLVAMAITAGGTFATLDERCAARYPEDVVEVVR